MNKEMKIPFASQKKIVTVLMVCVLCVLAATMSVGLTSCKEDEKKPKTDYSKLLIGRWSFTPIGYQVGYTITFNSDSTYFYETPKIGSGSGEYQILQTLENKEIKYNNGDEEVTQEATLIKIGVTPNGVFEQIWVYYTLNNTIVVFFYSNGEFLQDDIFFLTNFG